MRWWLRLVDALVASPPPLRKGSAFPSGHLTICGYAAGAGGVASIVLEPYGKPQAFRKGRGKAANGILDQVGRVKFMEEILRLQSVRLQIR